MRDFTLNEHGSLLLCGHTIVQNPGARPSLAEMRYLTHWLFMPHYEFSALALASVAHDPLRFNARLPPGPGGSLITADIVEFDSFLQSSSGPVPNSSLPGMFAPFVKLETIDRAVRMSFRRDMSHSYLDCWLQFIVYNILREWGMFLRGSLSVTMFNGSETIAGRIVCDYGAVDFIPSDDEFIDSWDDISPEPAQ